MPQGKIKVWNPGKGYGVISVDEQQDHGDDLYVYCSEISEQDIPTVHVGQRVAFDIVNGATGIQAAHVITLPK